MRAVRDQRLRGRRPCNSACFSAWASDPPSSDALCSSLCPAVHALANAIDIAGFTLARGFPITAWIRPVPQRPPATIGKVSDMSTQWFRRLGRLEGRGVLAGKRHVWRGSRVMMMQAVRAERMRCSNFVSFRRYLIRRHAHRPTPGFDPELTFGQTEIPRCSGIGRPPRRSSSGKAPRWRRRNGARMSKSRSRPAGPSEVSPRRVRLHHMTWGTGQTICVVGQPQTNPAGTADQRSRVPWRRSSCRRAAPCRRARP
jgi:hypothetical protein